MQDVNAGVGDSIQTCFAQLRYINSYCALQASPSQQASASFGVIE
jgi:hypothetical protein